MKGQSGLKENWQTVVQKTVDLQFLHLIQLSLRCFCQMHSCQSKQDIYFYIFLVRDSCKLKQFKHQRKELARLALHSWSRFTLWLLPQWLLPHQSSISNWWMTLSPNCIAPVFISSSKKINNINLHIEFMSKKEKDGKLLFLDLCSCEDWWEHKDHCVQRGAAGRCSKIKEHSGPTSARTGWWKSNSTGTPNSNQKWLNSNQQIAFADLSTIQSEIKCLERPKEKIKDNCFLPSLADDSSIGS